MSQFYSSLGCFYPSGTTGRVVSSNTVCVCVGVGGGNGHGQCKAVLGVVLTLE